MKRLYRLDDLSFDGNGLALHRGLCFGHGTADSGLRSCLRPLSGANIARPAQVAQVVREGRRSAGQSSKLPARLLGLHHILVRRILAEHIRAVALGNRHSGKRGTKAHAGGKDKKAFHDFKSPYEKSWKVSGNG
jgi:hypothetical protein